MTEMARHTPYTPCTQAVHTLCAAVAVAYGLLVSTQMAEAQASAETENLLAVIEDIVEDACLPFIEAERTMPWPWWFNSDRLGYSSRSDSGPRSMDYEVPDAPVTLSLNIGDKVTDCSFRSFDDQPWTEETNLALSEYAQGLASRWVIDDPVEVDLSGGAFEQHWIVRPRGLHGRFVMFFRNATPPGYPPSTHFVVGLGTFTGEAPDA